MSRPKLLIAAMLLAFAPAVPAALAQTGAKDTRLTETPAAAAPTAETQAPVQPWIINCTNQGSGDTLRCTMVQTIVARETGQRVVSAVIFREADALKITFGLPHGLDLPAGITLNVDEDAPVRTDIRTADQNGSYATTDMTPEMLARLKAGSVLNVGVTAATGGKVTLQLSLVGFSAAIDRV